MPPLVWVTGAGGLIGSHIVRAAAQRPSLWRVRPLTREQLDLCDPQAVQRAFETDPPQVVIHCAALTRSAACQTDPALAWRVNFEAARHLAHLSMEIPLVFFSTDLVFDGRAGNYSESAPVNPLSVYGETKAAAEQVILENPRHTILRTSLNAGRSPTGDRGLEEQLRLAWANGQTTRLFTDEFRSPIGADFTARAVWEVVEHKLRGLFHCGGPERLSRWEIGRLVAARYAHLRPRMEPGSFRDYAGPPRSPDTSLNSGTLMKLLSFRPPPFQQWLEENTA